MNRKQAWSHYFTTGDRTPLVEAYWDSINYIAWAHYPKTQEDMFQVGMMGLLKAIRRLDRDRVKSLDAWVFLNVRNMMFNARQFKPTYDIESLYETPYVEDEYDLGFDVVLSKREQLIVNLVHVHKYKRTEVAEMFGLSSMRIGQIEKEALIKLKTGTQEVKRPL